MSAVFVRSYAMCVNRGVQVGEQAERLQTKAGEHRPTSAAQPRRIKPGERSRVLPNLSPNLNTFIDRL